MQTALLFVLLPFAALIVGGAIIALNAFRSAPEGHQDADGFHFGSELQPAHAQSADELNLAA